MEKLTAYFCNDYRLSRQSAWFKRLLYAIVIIKTLLWLAYYPVYFGENSVIYSKAFYASGVGQIAFFLYGHPSLAFWCIIALLTFSLFAWFFPGFYLLPDLFIWLLAINIHNCLYATLTGGDYLLNQFLLFNCFLAISHNTFSAWSGLKIILHNLAATAVMVQVCLVYFLSALAKLADPQWLHGTAVFDVSLVHHYFIHSNPNTQPYWLDYALNYAVLFYQLLFPLLVWVKKIKKPFVTVGVVMHLFIAFVMGLPLFGAVMLAGYVYFWPTKKEF